MKNVSFMQLVLGITGGILIYSGIKDIDLAGFLNSLVKTPGDTFQYAWSYKVRHTQTGQPVPSSNTNPSSGTTGGFKQA